MCEHKTFSHKLIACWIFAKSIFPQMPNVLCSNESSAFQSFRVPKDFWLFLETIGFLKVFGFMKCYIVTH